MTVFSKPIDRILSSPSLRVDKYLNNLWEKDIFSYFSSLKSVIGGYPYWFRAFDVKLEMYSYCSFVHKQFAGVDVQ